MNTKMKKVLIGFASLLVVVALIAIAPISRIIYSIYDANRTNEILAQLEAEATKPQEGDTVNNFHKQAYLSTSQETDGGKTVEITNLLVLTSDSDYELNYYERVVEGANSFTSEYFRMTGTYTREGNLLTVEPGIGVLAQSQDGVSYVYYNAQYLTAEEAGGDKTRDEVYDMKYDSRQIALMQDGSFVVGGQSDATDELSAPAGRNVYTDYVAQGRKTYKTLVILEDGTYYVYSQATNSNNVEQTTGALFGYSTYEIKDSGKGIVPDESKPEETYDIVTGEPGIGYMYANNNGSHMHFDLQTHSGFLSWLATNFNASSPTFYVTETGFTMKLGALKTVVAPWGLYIPAADSETPEEPVTDSFTLEVETTVEGKPFILQFNADGTLRTGWTNYEQTLEDGKWRFVNDALVLDMAYGATVAKNADGGLDVTVDYGQMGQKTYTIEAKVVAAMKAIELPAESIRLELETSAEGKPFILEFNPDGTLRTGWTNYEQTVMDGKWQIADGKLVMDMAYGSAVAENADGGWDITVDYGQMGQKIYTMTAQQVAALKSIELPVQSVKLEIETSVEGKPFILELNPDGTLRTGWTNYEQTLMDGTWTVTDGTLVLDMVYGSTVAENADGGLDITVDYGQMGQKTYTIAAQQLAALTGVATPAGEDVTLEIETSVEGKPFVLELKADGTLRSGWTNYEQTMMDGTWTVTDGALVLEMPYTSTVAENAEGGLDITVDYGQMGSKTYTMTAQQLATLTGEEAPAGVDIKLEIETSVEGKPFVLELNADGSLRTGWTNYEQTMMDGTWTVTDGVLVLDMAYGSTVAENADGGWDITVDYGQMGQKVYTMTADQVKAIVK